MTSFKKFLSRCAFKFLEFVLDFYDNLTIAKTFVLVLCMFLLFILFSSCGDPVYPNPNATLEKQNYTNIIFQGGEGKGCRDYEIVTQRFSAKRDGVKWSGVVCCYEVQNDSDPCTIRAIGQVSE